MMPTSRAARRVHQRPTASEWTGEAPDERRRRKAMEALAALSALVESGELAARLQAGWEALTAGLAEGVRLIDAMFAMAKQARDDDHGDDRDGPGREGHERSTGMATTDKAPTTDETLVMALQAMDRKLVAVSDALLLLVEFVQREMPDAYWRPELDDVRHVVIRVREGRR